MSMLRLDVPVLSTKQFKYLPESRKFIADISDFGGKDFVSKIWADSCDMGFELESHKTGKRILFIFTGVLGNIESWLFGSFPSRGDTPSYIVEIFND